MEIKYDGLVDLATGAKACTKIWTNSKWLWGDLVKKLTTPKYTDTKLSAFLKLDKQSQSAIKDVGGYVGGYVRTGRRNPQNITHRQLVTLDLDFAYPEFWDDFCMLFNCAAVIHGTHKSTEDNPRFRLVLPLSREVSPDEYVAISRKIAGDLGIDYFDSTTFETNRLMFFPSTPPDVKFYSEFQDAPWLDADEVLASYKDWRDTSSWATSADKINEISSKVAKQKDPETKTGLIGYFCRTYGIKEAIDKFLSDVYSPCANDDDRYTYLKGSTAGGLVIYDDKFAYSHHGTDPTSGKLCNSFDLVRIHLFGYLDDNEDVPEAKSKSFKEMQVLAGEDAEVKGTIGEEHLNDAKYDFAIEDDATEIEAKEIDTTWTKSLEVDGKGKYTSSSYNISTILKKDSNLQDSIALNLFDGKRYALSNLPWRKVSKADPLRDVDYSGFRNYIDTVYGITSSPKIDDALALEFEKKAFHPIKDYLASLVWDGKSRVDKLLIEYFGADDNLYTREAMRKMLVAAVARVHLPAVKFDLMLVLVDSKQGTGKSSFLGKLGGEWFSDTFNTVSGNASFEQLQGAWIIEAAELSGLRKAEVEATKHFISKQSDSYRAAYGRTVDKRPRQCVFFGTTNNVEFLKDPTGNRRFIPIDCHMERATKVASADPDIDNFDAERDQVWAEAMHFFKKGEKLYLSKEAEAIARDEQSSHCEVDERKGVVEYYLDTLLPKDWEKKDILDRRRFLEERLVEGTLKREYVCVAEIWCECLGKNKEDMSKYNTRDVNDILRSLKDWEMAKGTRTFGLYGKQKYYSRKII